MSSAVAVNSIAVDRGLGWITDAFGIFMKAPLIWIVLMLIVFVGMSIVSFVPLGGLLTALFGPVIYAGLLLGCDQQRQGEPLKFETLIAGFKSPHLMRLILLGLLNLVAFFVLGLLVVFVIGGSIGTAMFSGGEAAAFDFGALFSVGMLVVLALVVPISMAFWFATPLVALSGIEPLEAIKLSFRGCLVNIGPFLIYGLLMLLAGIVAMIPLGLGLLILAPIGFISMYIGYREIFTAADTPAMA